MGKRTGLLIILSSILVFSGCESKVNEKPANGFNHSFSADAQVKAQSQLDEKMIQLDGYVGRLKQMIALAQAFLKLPNSTTLSLFDVVSQVNAKIQKQALILRDQKLLMTGQFEISTSLLADECKFFDYQVTSESLIPLTQIDYSMKSCYANENFLNVFSALFEEGRVQLKFNDENIKKLLPTDVIEPKITECRFSSRASEPTVCNDLMFAQSSKLVWFADIINQGSTEITISAYSKADGSVAYRGRFKFSADGKIDDVAIDLPLAGDDQ